VSGAVAGLVRREGHAGAQVGADEQRVDDTCGGAGVGETLVAAGRDLGEGEGSAAEHAGDGSDFDDVGGRVAADAIGIAVVDGVDLMAGDLFAIGGGDAEVAGDGFQTVIGQFPSGEVVAEDGVECVDQFPARRDVTDAAFLVGVGRAAAAGRASAEAGRSNAAKGERDAEELGAASKKGEVEAVEVVILDDVRVGGGDAGDKVADEGGFAGVAGSGSFEGGGLAGGVAEGSEEDAVAFRVEAGGFEIELEAVEMVEGEVVEVGAAGGDEVLLFGCESEDGLFAEIAEVGDAAAQAAAGCFKYGGDEGAAVGGGDQIAKSAGAVEFADGEGAGRRQVIEEKPGLEAGFFVDELAG